MEWGAVGGKTYVNAVDCAFDLVADVLAGAAGAAGGVGRHCDLCGAGDLRVLMGSKAGYWKYGSRNNESLQWNDVLYIASVASGL